MTMRLVRHLVPLSAARVSDPKAAVILERVSRAFFRDEKDAEKIHVAAFQLDVRRVTTSRRAANNRELQP